RRATCERTVEIVDRQPAGFCRLANGERVTSGRHDCVADGGRGGLSRSGVGILQELISLRARRHAEVALRVSREAEIGMLGRQRLQQWGGTDDTAELWDAERRASCGARIPQRRG